MKSVRPTRALLLLVTSLGMIGCGGSPDKKLIGKWELDTVALKEAAPDEQGAAALDALKMTFEFKSDHAMTVTISMGPMNMSTEGKWEVIKSSGDTATIRTEMENPVTKEVDTDEGTVTFVDKDTIEMTPPKKADMPIDKITLKRIKS